VCHAVPEHPHPHGFLGLGGARRAARPDPSRARVGPDSPPACPARDGVPWHGGPAAGDRGAMVTGPRAPRLGPGAHPRRLGRSRRRDLPRGPGTLERSDCDEYPWPHGQDLVAQGEDVCAKRDVGRPWTREHGSEARLVTGAAVLERRTPVAVMEAVMGNEPKE
jgi:hypothetical protein